MTIRRNLLLLSLAQGVLTLNNITLIAINGLHGLALAPDPSLATLPVATFVAGAAVNALPASWYMHHHGRRAGFRLGAVLGILGNLIALAGTWNRDFLLVCLGSLFCGLHNAFGQQYRFAAADTASDAWKSRAISLTLAGGILGGVLGPELSKWTRTLIEPMFAASYAALALLGIFSWLLLGRLQIPHHPEGSPSQPLPRRPFGHIIRQPLYLVAVLASTTGYGVMNLLMSATPLVMLGCQHPFDSAALVLEWHVLGMFVPSFFTGAWIQRFGVTRVLLVGAGLLAFCLIIALSGTSVAHFWWSLLFLGVAWNFLYIGGTTLLTLCHRPEEKAVAQGFNDFLVFGVQTVTAFSSGAIANRSGWDGVIHGALPATLLLTAALLWLLHRTGKSGITRPIPL
ncbi:MAG: MFS transporter [Magnetococcales bacterium]|nr:MFS transporter [Magnetococcales bacterium]NGZ07317.1 MFS transporter [Magnetococcales bacterium]